MEAITGFVLILLSSVGARNIPVHTGQSSELPLVFHGPSQHGYKKTPLAVIFPAGEIVESVNYVADLGLPLNKDNDEFEKVEDHVNNVMDLDNDIIGNMDFHESASYKKKKIPNKNGVLRPVGVIKWRKNQKGNKALLGFRVAFDGNACPKGTVRVVNECVPEDKGGE